MDEEIKKLCRLVIQMICLGEYEELQNILEEFQEIQDEALDEIREVMELYRLESESITNIHSEWFASHNWEEIWGGYRWLCDTLCVLADGKENEQTELLRHKIMAGQISHDAVRVAMHRLTLRGKTLKLQWELPEKPLVSVIVCVYNGETFVRDTLDSIIRQNYADLEILVVDDKSTDGSRAVIEEYAKADDRIVPVFLEKNRNICYAGNVGFERARGKYVALIGHDDVWERDKIQKQVSFMEEHPAYSACLSWVTVIDEKGCAISENDNHGALAKIFNSENFSQKEWNRRMFFEHNRICAPSALIRREMLGESSLYWYALAQMQDYDLWMRLLLKGNVYVVQEKLTFYRRFLKGNANISNMTLERETRAWHEVQWILYHYIQTMPDGMFRLFFRKELRKPELMTQKAVLCEKAFVLWGVGNCFAEKEFVELLQDAKVRELLENEYGFMLQDFYEMNTQPMYFDAYLSVVVQNQNEIIEKYRSAGSVQEE